MDKTNILLTGASRGIGFEICNELSSVGSYNLFAPKRSELDLSDNKSIDEYFSDKPDFDVLINNAGINIIGSIDSIDRNSINSMLQVNLIAPILLIQKVADSMKRKRYGRILNVSSIWGVRSKEFRTLYSATKFAVNGITRSLSRELGPYNILVNSICPGYVNTEMTKQNVPAKIQEEIKKEIPLGRFANPSEIAKAVSFLVSDENTYITGQTITIDGGFLA